METHSQNDTNAEQEKQVRGTDQPATPGTRRQKPLLFFAVLGISFAGWYGWDHRLEIEAFCSNTSVNALLQREQGLNNSVDAVFNTEELLLPLNEIRNGGVPKDGIPALVEPEFLTVAEATFMEPTDRLAGVVVEGQARAYPLKILDRHEVVNDKIGNTSIAVTYCPLCDSLAVYNREGSGGTLELGVSGFLYNSNVLLYDRSGSSGTDGLWSQMMSQGVAGPRANEQFLVMPVEMTTWEDWTQRYPNTQVLSDETGHQRNYSQRAYASYFADDMALMFDVNNVDNRLPYKVPLLGVWVGDKRRAYPVTAFQHLTEPLEIEQELDGKKFTLVYHPQAKSLRVAKSDQGVRWMYSFWFAWYAFYPDTELYSPPEITSKTAIKAEKP